MEQMNRTTLTAALAAVITACGGGGGDASEPTEAPVKASHPVLQAAKPPVLVNPNCRVLAGSTQCDLFASTDEMGVSIRPHTYATFTNNTGVELQVDRVQAYSGERQFWSEYCTALINSNADWTTGQYSAGVGEVGCVHKEAGEDYQALTWGGWSGLRVKPGQTLIVGSHTEPVSITHTYSLRVRYAQTALESWRQPQIDAVIPCNGQAQSTAWTPWKNTTGRAMKVTGASIYAVSGNANPGRVNGNACLYVLKADGSVKQSICSEALAARGEFTAGMTVEHGESLAGQATNTCTAPNQWDWAVWMRVW